MAIIQFSSEVLNAGNTPSIKADVAANLPASAATGAIYITTDTNIIYRWSGSSWISIGGGSGAITGSGTNNYIPQFTGSSSVGDSSIYFTAGSIGISPSYTIGTNTNLFQLFTAAAAQPIGLYIYEAAATGFNIQRIVGSPNYNSIYSGNSDIQIRVFDGATNYDTRIFKNGNIAINSNTDNGNRLQVTGTGYFSGNVGVGTGTPGAPLDIHGTGTIAQFNGTGTNNAFVFFQNAGSGKWRIGNNYSGATNYFSLFDVTNSVETLKITQGSGTTSLATYQGQITALKGYIAAGSTGTIFFQASPSAANELCFYAAGTVTGNCYMTYGNISATGSVFQYVSNTNNASTSAHAVLQLSTNGAAGGDPYVLFGNGVNNFIAGLANGFSDNFHIQTGTSFTGSPSICVNPSSGRVMIGTNADNGYTLRVQGNLYVNSTADFQNNLTMYANIRCGVSSVEIGSSTTVTRYVYSREILGPNTGQLMTLRGSGLITTTGVDIIGTNAATGLAYIYDGAYSTSNATILSLESTTRGFRPPRMTTAQKNAIVSPTAGLIVYDTTLNKLCVYTTAWETITSV